MNLSNPSTRVVAVPIPAPPREATVPAPKRPEPVLKT
jgi:hypothetical protein